MLRGVLDVIMKNTLPVENEAIKVGGVNSRGRIGCDFPPEGILRHLSHLKGLWVNPRSDEYSR